jgi:hypothetical protein
VKTFWVVTPRTDCFCRNTSTYLRVNTASQPRTSLSTQNKHEARSVQNEARGTQCTERGTRHAVHSMRHEARSVQHEARGTQVTARDTRHAVHRMRHETRSAKPHCKHLSCSLCNKSISVILSILIHKSRCRAEGTVSNAISHQLLALENVDLCE